ncbi:unnamed protein product [Paramecium primaurelia]|uniref:Uncharacterized protein n=1 Tax=Paramecium primaurelia TaxID=5886 RepID=A0A8S1NCB0_PARPR|nr:unnamed protein product [Paramecium primaurelia]
MYAANHQLHQISQVDVWTPKNVKVSLELMKDVIQTLQREENVLLEHVNTEVRIFSLLCSSLAWLKSQKENSTNLEKQKSLRIVYVSQNQAYLNQAEEQLKKTIYKNKLIYFKEDLSLNQILEHDLIFMTKDSLISYEQQDLKNSILIFDSFECVQDQKLLTKISLKAIEIAQKELDDLASKRQQMEAYFSELHSYENIKKLMQYFLEFQFNNQYDKRKEIDIKLIIENYFIKRNLSFNTYMGYVQVILRQQDASKLDNLSLWCKFIKSVYKLFINKQDYTDNYKSYINKNKNGNVIFICLRYYSQYMLDHLRNLKFQSIIISSKYLSSPYDQFLNKIQIKQIVDQSQFFQTFYIQSHNENFGLLKTLNNIYKSIPNSILVIFQQRDKINEFKNYCEKEQSNIFLEMEKKKKLFWAQKGQKYKPYDFITSSKDGAILFETYSGIFKKEFNFPNSFQFCKAIILTCMCEPNYFKVEEVQYANDEISLQYFQNRSFNRIIQRTLLQENKNGVLIIYDQKEKMYKWIENCGIQQLNQLDFDNPFFIKMIERQCKDSIEVEKESNQNNVQVIQQQIQSGIQNNQQSIAMNLSLVPNLQQIENQQQQQNINVSTIENIQIEQIESESEDSFDQFEYTFQD